jgi:hypothetical protein
MPNYAVIENDKVVNVCVAEILDSKPDNWVLCEVGNIGWNYIDGAFVPPYVAPVEIDYKMQRAAAYPPIGDQLDALWKGGDAAAEMLAQVQAVKAQYPKPE